MPTMIDLAKRLKSQGAGRAAASGGASGVRYGTVQSVSGSAATVKLDGSDEAVTLTTDATVSDGERVRVVSQGSSYAVVALKGVASDAKKALADAGDAVVKATEVESELGSYKVSVSETYATQDSLAALSSTVTQTASDLTAEFTAMVGDVSGANMMRGSAAWSALTGGKWEDGAVRVTGSATVTSCSEAAPAGAAGCAVTLVTPKTDGTQGGFCQDAYPSVEAGQAYTLSCWVKASKAGAAFTVHPMWWSGIDSGFSKDVTLGAAGAWQRVTHTFTPTAGATGVSIGYFMGTTACDYWVAGCKVERGGVATAWDAGVQDTSTLIRQSGDGVEVARKSGGAYTGTRALLGSDALEFRSADGSTTLASFGADEVTLGNLFAPHVSIGTDSFRIMKSLITLVTIANDSTLGPYIDGDGALSLRSSDTLPTAEVRMSTTTSGSSTTGTVKLSASNPSNILKGATLTLDSSGGLTFAADSSAKLSVTSSAVSCGSLKAASVGSTTLASGTAYAYRHLGVVYLYLNAHSFSSALSGTTATVGTLPAGWRPPAVVKGGLYVGSQLYAAQVSVDASGVVKVYSSSLPKGQQVSGYVIYPATQ